MYVLLIFDRFGRPPGPIDCLREFYRVWAANRQRTMMSIERALEPSFSANYLSNLGRLPAPRRSEVALSDFAEALMHEW